MGTSIDWTGLVGAKETRPHMSHERLWLVAQCVLSAALWLGLALAFLAVLITIAFVLAQLDLREPMIELLVGLSASGVFFLMRGLYLRLRSMMLKTTNAPVIL